ncbi:hypothetical protein SDC9_209894 [bioreactor metagenome]|uniref:Uncharacterized protein n=1 Tax=bioreactor metagenome TaxID=1076179 RepID=A0A645JFK9_9ZZZZ
MRLARRPQDLNEAPSPEQQEHDGGDQPHQPQGIEKSVWGFEPGHHLEIHAENAGDQCGRHKDRRDDGQCTDVKVDAMADRGQVYIQQAGSQVAKVFQRLEDVYGVVIDIADVQLDVGPKEISRVTM